MSSANNVSLDVINAVMAIPVKNVKFQNLKEMPKIYVNALQGFMMMEINLNVKVFLF